MIVIAYNPDLQPKKQRTARLSTALNSSAGVRVLPAAAIRRTSGDTPSADSLRI